MARNQDFEEAERIAERWIGRLVFWRQQTANSSGALRATDATRNTGAAKPAQPWANSTSRQQDQYLTIEVAMQSLGTRTAAVLEGRLSGRRKSSERSWAAVAAKAGCTATEAREVYQIGVPLFVLEMQRRGLEE